MKFKDCANSRNPNKLSLKNKLDERIFPAKILLFGEYSVLIGGEALAIPWEQQYAVWKKDSFYKSSGLLDLYFYLKARSFPHIDLISFYQSIQSGWHLESNIIQGYGLGSSGSTTAAVYNRFKNEEEHDLQELRALFAHMESFYHGHSSGFDPVISYTGEIIHIQGSGLLQSHRSDLKLSNFYLIDSKVKRSPNRKVSDTLKKLEASKELGESLVRLQNAAIQSIMQDTAHLTEAVKQISAFQVQNFRELIPVELISWWEEGLRHNHFYLKLCGAGGGGFYLAYTEQLEYLDRLRDSFPIIRLANHSSVRY